MTTDQGAPAAMTAAPPPAGARYEPSRTAARVWAAMARMRTERVSLVGKDVTVRLNPIDYRACLDSLAVPRDADPHDNPPFLIYGLRAYPDDVIGPGEIALRIEVRA